MFRRKRTTGDSAKEEKPCWDDKTQASFAELDRFDIYITSVTKRTGFGRSSTHNLDGDREYEISGLMIYPKWRAELKFDDSDGEFGVWFYHTYAPIGGQTRQPFLEIWVSDRDYAIQEAMASAHHATLVSGHKRSLVSFGNVKATGFSRRKKPKSAGPATVAIH